MKRRAVLLAEVYGVFVPKEWVKFNAIFQVHSPSHRREDPLTIQL